MRTYSIVNLIRFKNFAEKNQHLSNVELLQLYNELYPEKTKEEKRKNLLRALGIRN